MFRMSDEQQEKVLNNFIKVMDKQNPKLINKDLYYHLNLNCNFVAHFNLNGFRDAYSGEHFQDFVNFFSSTSPESQWLEAPEISTEFSHLNQAMMDYVSSQPPS
ncbi:hypothetical protein Desdi_1963 [Desulfitobacterium dichloroeliminans LMG P-21439]|uniref:Uncharacterized protein n=1 Tax=Desulfitobacterium dichloroeliminans (strain LMG P-21439 / DCA1) TaxID=871963 RepID=L0F9R9_DESDL|nr:hypothetical protein [Desulfitobacterium dichloroeliminans]AGA69411.1 hypothetical protein Desdi_1963 [Desulfitobacterium dichloroeliminans LMG P-21439]